MNILFLFFEFFYLSIFEIILEYINNNIAITSNKLLIIIILSNNTTIKIRVNPINCDILVKVEFNITCSTVYYIHQTFSY